MNEQEAMQILADMGLHEGGMDNWVPDNAWYRFANVVDAAARADEREKCAKLCERTKGLDRSGWPQHYAAHELAAAIRARGTT
jgi:hypothetical protein